MDSKDKARLFGNGTVADMVCSNVGTVQGVTGITKGDDE